jgi:hypothetical protein
MGMMATEPYFEQMQELLGLDSDSLSIKASDVG